MLIKSFKNYRNLKTYPENLNLSSQELEKYKDKDWYVRFRYFDERTGKWVLKIYKGGVNHTDIPTKERVAQLNALKKALLYKLEVEQWNPLTKTYPQEITAGEMDLQKLKQMTFYQALDYAVKKKSVDWSHKTKQDYNTAVKYLKKASDILNISGTVIVDLQRLHYRSLLEKVRETRNLTSKGFNKYRDYLSSLIGELVQYDILDYNPIHKIKSKEVIKVQAHRPPTKDERIIIVDRIRNEYPAYYRFISVLYGCTIRPKEICALKIKHLHKLEQIFRIIPNRQEENSKTLIEREVVIPDWVMSTLSTLNLHNYDPEWYIFSSRNKYGTFFPGPNRMHSNTPTSWWRRIVKKDLKLDVNQYSLKKLSGNDMVKLQVHEGVDKLLEMPRQQMGHTTTKMTETYVDAHREIMNELLKRKMPVL